MVYPKAKKAAGKHKFGLFPASPDIGKGNTYDFSDSLGNAIDGDSHCLHMVFSFQILVGLGQYALNKFPISKNPLICLLQFSCLS